MTIRAVSACYSAKACAVAIAFLLLADTAIAQKEAGFISLIPTSVSARRYFDTVLVDGGPIDSVLFTCRLQVGNRTGMDLAVPSTFGTAFGDLELVVTDLKGKVLSQVPHNAHLSRTKLTPTLVPIRQGATEAELKFDVLGLGQEVKTVKVRLVGTFPGSAYKRICSSDTVQVSIDESLREAH